MYIIGRGIGGGSMADKSGVSRFASRAQEILDVASSGGRSCAELTILIGSDGAIQLVSDSDWPLEALVV